MLDCYIFIYTDRCRFSLARRNVRKYIGKEDDMYHEVMGK